MCEGGLEVRSTGHFDFVRRACPSGGCVATGYAVAMAHRRAAKALCGEAAIWVSHGDTPAAGDGVEAGLVRVGSSNGPRPTPASS